ncbi:MAG TPA: RDD family protein [Stellaceae bacterium]|nr:RDD family protein [Stellaceae bacterium]
MSAYHEIERVKWTGDPPEPFAAPEYYQGVLIRRVFAYWVDLLCIGLLIALAWIVFSMLAIASLGLLSPLLLILGLIPVLYHTLTIGGPLSATPGMRLTGVEVRSWTGERPSYLQAFVQTILFYVTVYPTWALVLAIALLDRRRRTLHDMLAGTLVIRISPQAEVLAAR